MGIQAQEVLEIESVDALTNYLRAQTRVFMEVEGKAYYITHTDGYWRAQDCAVYNSKGHFTDCSELVTLVTDMISLPWLDGKSIADVFENATFYASIQEEPAAE